MQVLVNGDIDDINAMMISAVRYALGRRTYIVSWTCEFVTSNKHLLTAKYKYVIIRDIKDQAKYGYGDRCDEECWMKLLEVLEGED